MSMDLASRPTLVHIQGHNFWLHFLPPIVRARMIAESVRLVYCGRMPAKGVELLMPDGRFWKLRVVEGDAPPHRNGLESKLPKWLAAVARWLDLALAWHIEIQRAMGRGTFERWEPVPEKRGQLVGGQSHPAI